MKLASCALLKNLTRNHGLWVMVGKVIYLYTYLAMTYRVHAYRDVTVNRSEFGDRGRKAPV